MSIIWDLDGTLSDSLQLGYLSTNHVLSLNGYSQINEEEYKIASKYPTNQRMSFHATNNPNNHEIGELLGKQFDDYYIDLVDNHNSCLFPEINILLVELKNRGYKMSILSNASSKYVQKVLKVNEIEDLFVCCYGVDDVGLGKPNPDGLNKIITQHYDNDNRIDNNNDNIDNIDNYKHLCIYIGDSQSDGEAAKLCGIYSIGVSWGNSNYDTLKGNFNLLIIYYSLLLLLFDSIILDYFSEVVESVSELRQSIDIYFSKHQTKKKRVSWRSDTVDNENLNKFRIDDEYWDKDER